MTFRQFAFRNVVRNRRVYAAFFMASVFSVMVFFLNSMLLFHPSIESSALKDIAFLGMGTAEIILYIFTVFFLFYSMRAFLQARTKEFGILLQLGMQKRQLHRLIFTETILIGAASIGVGTFLGYMFSKFFFMVVKRIVMFSYLPLYFSWKPFALTVGAFLSLFMIISLVAPVFIRTGQLLELIRGEVNEKEKLGFSKVRGILGVLLLGMSYTLAALTSNSIVIGLVFLLPPLATVGTYYFFTDSLPLILHLLKLRKEFYWRHFRLLAISEGIVRIKENARMFFIVTIVSTVAFMSVGILASLTSFASQYREVNPLGLVYKSFPGNELEHQHLRQIHEDLKSNGLDYTHVRFPVLEQQSSATAFTVNIVRIADINKLAKSSGNQALELSKGEALFLPPTTSTFAQLNKQTVETVLQESGVAERIDGAYPYQLFPAHALGTNAIVVSNEDFEAIARFVDQPAFVYHAYDIQDWQETKNIGLSINHALGESMITGSTYAPRFYFDNPGLNYSVMRTTFTLLLLIGLLLAGVFLLAAGSFIYFRLYTSLDSDRKQFDVLRRMGITDKEFKKIVNRQLIPQFFIPWSVALIHSSFAFLSLQVIWDALAEISIVRELIMVLVGFTLLQIVYFYLIRWRYLAHIRTPG
ncbi:ABC transporter permease [Sporosarcina saromensis]|uniref:ABC transporter permease n=1 Tax=Sporosarcina saromensis TaxID=359365 RepID=A0ABU4G871_9BACL|nr:ABC transporter permease [Sporosarcina saromensis]MDW0112577.1 ABC transporter permease [Sporosarcina saromensis]